VAAYAGLRRGELVALRWRDVDFLGHKIIVRRSLSAETELWSTKSRRAREVPLPDQAAAALERLSRRGEFSGPDDYVFVNRFGRRLDPSALRRRSERKGRHGPFTGFDHRALPARATRRRARPPFTRALGGASAVSDLTHAA
jgi:integrase